MFLGFSERNSRFWLDVLDSFDRVLNGNCMVFAMINKKKLPRSPFKPQDGPRHHYTPRPQIKRFLSHSITVLNKIPSRKIAKIKFKSLSTH